MAMAPALSAHPSIGDLRIEISGGSHRDAVARQPRVIERVTQRQRRIVARDRLEGIGREIARCHAFEDR